VANRPTIGCEARLRRRAPPFKALRNPAPGLFMSGNTALPRVPPGYTPPLYAPGRGAESLINPAGSRRSGARLTTPADAFSPLLDAWRRSLDLFAARLRSFFAACRRRLRWRSCCFVFAPVP
jgi:hypothetical protein